MPKTTAQIRAELAALESRAAYLRRQLAARRHWLAQPINPGLRQQPLPQPKASPTSFVIFGD